MKPRPSNNSPRIVTLSVPLPDPPSFTFGTPFTLVHGPVRLLSRANRLMAQGERPVAETTVPPVMSVRVMSDSYSSTSSK